MKKEPPVKYPNSASLFQFCRRVLDHKFGGIRVIDQDVGQILGFDPADCSHWKKGKKNIRSIQAMKSIADHLGVDEKLVVDVASGEVADGEAFYEYSGYGKSFIEKQLYETAKKEFHRRHANTWTREKENEFRQHFSLNADRIQKLVSDIHQKVDFNEAPLYLPEIVAAYPGIELKSLDDPDVEVVTHKQVEQLEEHATHSPLDASVVVKPSLHSATQELPLRNDPSGHFEQVSIVSLHCSQVLLQSKHSPSISMVVPTGQAVRQSPS